MRRVPAALAALITLAACQGDETASAYGAADKIWHLKEINDDPFDAKAVLVFPEPGQISGSGPCNSFTGTMTVPYPWFEAGPLASTRRLCPNIDDETRYFKALGAMTLIEVLGDTLILSNDDGQSMLFRAGA